MGIFSYRPAGPGKGVRKDEPKPIRLLLFFQIYFRKFFNFIKLSLLFIVASLPIVTIGPAISGMTYVLRTYSEETHSFIASDFFEYFRKNFAKSIGVTIVDLIVIYSSYLVYANLSIPQFSNLLIPMIIIDIIFLIMNFYIFTLLITYDIPFFAVFKNAFIFTLIKLPMNLVIAFAFVAVIVLFFGFQPIIGAILGIFLLPSFLCFIAVFYVFPTITRHMEGEEVCQSYEERAEKIKRLTDEKNRNSLNK